MPTIPTNGAQIQYWKTGEGPVVLLIQGAGMIGEGWRPQIDALAGDYTLIWFDNRGVGRSRMESRPLTIESMAADAAAVLDAERIDRCHVIGHSMGGLIAQELALAGRPRIRSLSLLCTFVTGKDASVITLEMLVLGLRTRIGTRAMRRRAFLDLIFPEAFLRDADHPALAARLAPLVGHDLADQPPIVMKQLGAMSCYDARSRLATLSGIPTLVASAALDRIARPASGRALAAAIPGARFVEWPDQAHAAPIQTPALVNDLLREHLSAAEHARV